MKAKIPGPCFDLQAALLMTHGNRRRALCRLFLRQVNNTLELEDHVRSMSNVSKKQL